MSDLADFLLARIAEREARALVSTYRPDGLSPTLLLSECVAHRALVAYCTPDDDAGHALLGAFADPAVDSQVLAMTEPFARAAGTMVEEALADVLKYLALPYADHSDYDPGWKP